MHQLFSEECIFWYSSHTFRINTFRLEMKLQSCKTPHKLLSPFVASYLWMVQNVFPAMDKNSSKKNTTKIVGSHPRLQSPAR